MSKNLFDQADSEYNNGNFEKAFELFLKAAEDGNDSAMDRIASIYEAAEGVDYDFDKAIYWHRKAVDAGNITSFYKVIISLKIPEKKLLIHVASSRCVAAGKWNASLSIFCVELRKCVIAFF